MQVNNNYQCGENYEVNYQYRQNKVSQEALFNQYSLDTNLSCYTSTDLELYDELFISEYENYELLNSEMNLFYLNKYENNSKDNTMPYSLEGIREKTVYSLDGTVISKTYKDFNGNTKFSKTYYPNGSIKDKTLYSANSTIGLTTHTDEEGNEFYRLESFNSNGKKGSSWIELASKEAYDAAIQRDILKYSQFDLYQTYSLLRMDNDEWQKTNEILTKNPYASYDDLVK